jgi:sulfite reductase (ferredoxin)
MDGTRSEAFLVHLGGTLGEDGAFGRKVKGVRVFAEDTADYLETLLTRYEHRKRPGDTFAVFVARLDDDELQRFAQPEARAR